MMRGLWLRGFLACCSLPAADLDFLAGCWAGETADGRRFEEIWTRASPDGMLLGAARTMKAGRVVFHEFMRIDRTGAGGKAVFTPHIGSPEPPVVFTAVRLTAAEVVFENAAHDFPQRVIYRRTGNGAGLLGRIEGVEKGKPQSIDYPMKRAGCFVGPAKP